MLPFCESLAAGVKPNDARQVLNITIVHADFVHGNCRPYKVHSATNLAAIGTTRKPPERPRCIQPMWASVGPSFSADPQKWEAMIAVGIVPTP